MTTKKAKGRIELPEPQKLKLADVQFAPYNPRIMPPETMLALKASLLKHGMVLNLVVQKKGLVLIGGHQRVLAMRELCTEKGWEEPGEAWATVLDVDDATAKQLNVALNNIEGKFDAYKLGELFAGIRSDMTMDDIRATGFEPESIEELLKLVADPADAAAAFEDEAAGLAGFAKSVTLTVEFETVEQRDQAKQILSDQAKQSGKKAGAVLMQALKRQHLPAGKPKNGAPPKAKPKGQDRARA